MKFIAFDLETTGVDVETAEVVQATVVEASLSLTMHGYHLEIGETTTQLFFVASIPEGATAVHGIRAEDVADKPPFVHAVRSLVKGLTAPDVVAVSFNGCAYDIPIIARHLHATGTYAVSVVLGSAVSPTLSREMIERQLRASHIDVMRLWWRVKQSAGLAPWCDDEAHRYMSYAPRLTADMFAGSLVAAHGFFKGEGFGGAHDAGNDCRATLAVLGEMLMHVEGLTVDKAIQWSNEPLPGDVDFAGKFKWQGDRCVITIGKQAGTPIEQVEIGFLRWMRQRLSCGHERHRAQVLGRRVPAAKERDVTELQIILLIGAGAGLWFATDRNHGAAVVSAVCVLSTVALEIAKLVQW